MNIIFYNVGHGSCCHIITPLNQHILVDVGSKECESIVDHIKNKYDLANIDYLFITHPHEDHIFDLPKLFQKLLPKVLWRPKEAFDIKPKFDWGRHKEIANCANEMHHKYTSPISNVDNPLIEYNNGGVHFNLICPPPELCTKDDLNTFSPIIIVAYGNYKFVLTGDNTKKTLERMIETDHQDICQKIQNSTVLLAPHHGRSNEFCDQFFKIANPLLTVISDKNIDHSTQEESSFLYRGRGANINNSTRYVLTTRVDGTISFNLSAINDSLNVAFNSEGY